MTHQRQRRATMLGLLALATLPFADANGQTFPSQPVKMLIGFTAGGVTDVIGRAVARGMSTDLGQQVVVENRPGASTSIATGAAAKSTPNGYTIVMISSTTADAAALKSNLPYDLERDLAPISMVARGPLVLCVNASSPVHTVQDLIALAKSQPGKLNVSHEGVGGVVHLAAAMFNIMAGTDIVFVPYKGGADSAVALASGNVDVSLLSFPSAMAMIQANKIRPIAVTTKTRSPLMPNLPAVSETLSGYDQPIWIGLLAPAGTPPEVIGRLNGAVRKAMVMDDTKDATKSAGMEGVPGTPEEFAEAISGEIKRSADLGKRTGIKLD